MIDNKVGLVLAIIVIIITPFVPYRLFVKGKYFIVGILSFILFATKLGILDEYIFNEIATYLLMINIFGLFFIVKSIYIKILILIITITTPWLYIQDKKVIIQDNNLDKSVWIFLSTILLSYIYITHYGFRDTYYKYNHFMLMLAVILPMVLYIKYQKWAEYRAICLCVALIIDFSYYLRSFTLFTL